MSDDVQMLDMDDLDKVSGGIKITLLQDIPGKGRAGDVIEVSDGYAKNFLFPKGLARAFEPADSGKHKDAAAEFHALEEQRRQQEDPVYRAQLFAEFDKYLRRNSLLEYQ